MAKAKAAVLVKPGSPLEMREYPLVPREPGGLVVKVAMAGICGSDVHLAQGKRPDARYPMIPGHEIVGWIDQCDEGRTDAVGLPLKPGDRVLVFLSIFCGQCPSCLRKEYSLCAHRLIYGLSPYVSSEPPHFRGGYAEYLYASPASTVFRIPDKVPFEAAVSAACVGGTAFHAHRRVPLIPGDKVVVMGAGPLGSYCAALARDRGATVTIADVSPNRLQKAKPMADYTIDVAALPEHVSAQTGGHGADVIFTCAGNGATFATALSLLRRGGTMVEVGYGADIGEVSFNPYFGLTNKQASILGSWSLEPDDVLHVLAFLERGRYPFAELVTLKLPLEKANEGLEAVEKRTQQGKIVLVP